MKSPLFILFLMLSLATVLAEPKSTKKPAPKKVVAESTSTPEAAPAAALVGAVAGPAAATVESFDLNSDEAPSEFASRFFELLKKGEIDAAYNGLIKGSKIAERPEEVKALKAKTKEALSVFGAVLEAEVIDSKLVGQHLLRRTYVSIGKEFPLRWRFYFYKPVSTWRLVDIRVDDRLAGIFSEAEEGRSGDSKQ